MGCAFFNSAFSATTTVEVLGVVRHEGGAVGGVAHVVAVSTTCTLFGPPQDGARGIGQGVQSSVAAHGATQQTWRCWS